MSGRTFSPDEAQRIFARAAQRQHDARRSDHALTLEELQAIGLEAGIDPAHVAAAALEADAAPTPTWLGVPTGHRTVRRLGVPVTDAAWGRIVERLRAGRAVGDAVEEVGDRRIWTSDPGIHAHGTRVTVVPEGDGTAMTVESARATEPATAVFIAILAGTVALVAGLGLLLGKGDTGNLTALALAMIALTAVTTAAAVWSARRKARTRPGETDRLADDLARLVEASPAAPRAALEHEPPTPEPATALLDALEDVSDAETESRPRGRVRS